MNPAMRRGEEEGTAMIDAPGKRETSRLAERVRRDADRLRAALGRPRRKPSLGPLGELILTILSQNTSDTNSGRAFEALRRRFPTWEAAARAPRRAVESAIRAGGLARIKSRVIQETLRRIRRERDGLDLEFLRRIPVPEAIGWLRGFRGVGDKTACCVLLFGCGRAAFPVDTHILRIARRLGWIGAAAGAPEAHRRLAEAVPERRCYEIHVNLITLGRTLCRPRRPRCPECPLKTECRHAWISRS